MSSAATNKVERSGRSHSSQNSGVTVNHDIQVGGMDYWRREAIQKVIGFTNLAPNWDGEGSRGPSLAVRQTAMDLLLQVPGDYQVVRVVPISGGGYQFEWSVGDRDVEISIDGNSKIEALRVEDGVPVEDNETYSLREIFDWIYSR